MTATDIRTPPKAVTSAPRRIWNVVRLHVANPSTTLITPWVITAAIFAINLAIWLMVANAAGGREYVEPGAFTYNGGISWILFFMLVVGVQAMSRSFRFALGFSVTRRDYYLGSSLFFVLLSLLYSVGLSALAGIERATDGWGLNAAFFGPWGLADRSLLLVWFLFFMALLLFFFLGAATATVWVRWQANGLYVFFISLAVLLVVTAWGITVTDSWPAVGRFFTTNSLAVIATWTLPITVLCGVVGYLLLRKAPSRD